MSRLLRGRVAIAVVVTLLVGLSPTIHAAPPAQAADLIPASSVAYLEVNQPKELISFVMDNPLRQQLEQFPDFQKALESQDFKNFLTAVGLVEDRAGVKWRPALESITDGGISLAIDSQNQGVVMLVKSRDPKTTASVREALFGLMREDAKSKNQPDPIKTKEYRGLTAYQASDVSIADLGSWLMVTNKSNLAKTVADQYLDKGKGLGGEREFADARKMALAGSADAPLAWGYVRLAPLRAAGVAKPLLSPQEKSNNPGVELLLGGLLSTLNKSPFVTAALRREDKGLRLSITSPHDASWVPKERQFFFGHADAPLRPANTVLAVTTYRDVQGMWQSAPDLFTEGVAAQMAKADSDLSNFLGGKSFSADILGALEPQMQWITTKQDFKAAGVPEPTIRLPASAFVFRIKEGKGKTVQRSMRLAFQTALAFVNVDGATKNRPMLEMKTATRGKAEILLGAYEVEDPADANKPAADKSGADKATQKPVVKKEAPDPKKPDAKGPDGKAPDNAMMKAADNIYYNFTPALVLSDDYLMLCSTRQIAEELSDLAAKRAPAKGEPIAANTLIEADGVLAAQLLRLNREQLISQNMLEKGHDHAAAAKEGDLLMTLVDYVRKASVTLTPTDRSVRLDVELKTK